MLAAAIAVVVPERVPLRKELEPPSRLKVCPVVAKEIFLNLKALLIVASELTVKVPVAPAERSIVPPVKVSPLCWRLMVLAD